MPYMRMRPIVDQELGAGGAQELDEQRQAAPQTQLGLQILMADAETQMFAS